MSKTSVGGSVDDRDLATGERGEDGLDGARQRSAGGAVEDEDRERTAAGGGPPAGGPPRRGNRAVPCSASPATTTPRTPIARARVSVSASTREPTTRIVPARPDVEAARPQLAIGPGDVEPAARRAAERDDPADPATGRPDRDRRCPGRTSRTMPANGVSTGRRCRRSRRASGRATRTAYSPPRAVLSPRPGPAPVHAAPPGCARRRLASAGTLALVEPGVAQPFGDRRADHDRSPAVDERPVARRRARRAASTGAAISRRAGTSADVAGGHRASRPRRPRSATRRGAPPRGRARSGRRSGHVAQVDHQATEPAGHVDREVPAARPEPDRVAEMELGDRRAPGRQVDEREAAGHQVEPVEPVDAADARAEPALRPVRIPAGVTTVPSGASRSSTRSATIARRSSGVGDRARAAPRSRAWSSANWPSPRAGGGRRRGRARPTARRDAPRRRRRRSRGPAAARRSHRASLRRAGRGRRARRPSGAPAVAGRVGPRRDAQLAHPVAQAVPVGARGRPARDAVDRRVVGVRRARAARRGPSRHPSRAARPGRPAPARRAERRRRSRSR